VSALATTTRFVIRHATFDETFRALGTEVRLIATGPGGRGAVARARREILDYHARLSRFLPDSELSALNADPRPVVPASALLRSAVRAGLWAARRSGGLVDPCLLDALEAAGYEHSFEAGAPIGSPTGAPDHESSCELGEPLPPPSGAPRPATADPAAAWHAIRIDDDSGTIERPPGLRLDLGGSGKGHIADLVACHFAGTTDWVVDCGGDIRVGGARAVEIAHPLCLQRVAAKHASYPHGDAVPDAHAPALSPHAAARVLVTDGAIATSSVLSRAWQTSDGGRAHHLLDPATGQPAWTGLLSATALAPTTLHAETLAKIALLRGPDGAREVLARRGGLLVHGGGDVEPIGPLPELAR
jgi:thiamine biosynthesis lipoprotein